jgi:ribosomal protein S18 acetylase RimI-like enzyme
VHVPIDIRPGFPADAAAITRVRRESWLAAYAGIIDRALIDRATATGGSAASPPPYRRTLVAVGGDDPAVIGYAAFGPERTVVSAILPPVTPAGGHASAAPGDPLTPAGRAGDTGELYALYVTPAWWSAGAGRALMGSVLTALRDRPYARAVLWVLAENTRARRFYERAGFAPDGATNVLAGLGGVLEVRYARDL